jgi:hypothetical protein
MLKKIVSNGYHLEAGMEGTWIEEGHDWYGNGGRWEGVKCRFRLGGEQQELVVPKSAIRRR